MSEHQHTYYLDSEIVGKNEMGIPIIRSIFLECVTPGCKAIWRDNEIVRLVEGYETQVADLRRQLEEARKALAIFADEKNWMRDTEYRMPEWIGEGDSPWMIAQEALKEVEK